MNGSEVKDFSSSAQPRVRGGAASHVGAPAGAHRRQIQVPLRGPTDNESPRGGEARRWRISTWPSGPIPPRRGGPLKVLKIKTCFCFSDFLLGRSAIPLAVNPRRPSPLAEGSGE